MNDMAESKRNMRIDMRPRVFMRTMRLELLIFGGAALIWIGMPLYFLKIRPARQKQLEEDRLRREFEEMEASDKSTREF